MDFASALKMVVTCDDRTTPEYKEALKQVFLQAPADLRHKLDSVMHACYPDLQPDLLDEQGTPYYSAETLAKYFKMDVEEVKSKIGSVGAANFHGAKQGKCDCGGDDHSNCHKPLSKHIIN